MASSSKSILTRKMKINIKKKEDRLKKLIEERANAKQIEEEIQEVEIKPSKSRSSEPVKKPVQKPASKDSATTNSIPKTEAQESDQKQIPSESPAVKKAPVKKAPVKKTTAKKAPVKKTTAKKTSAKQSSSQESKDTSQSQEVS